MRPASFRRIVVLCFCLNGYQAFAQDLVDTWFFAAGGIGRPSAPPIFYDFWDLGISAEVGLLSRWSGPYYRGLSAEVSHFGLSDERFLSALNVASSSSAITGGSATLVSAGFLVGGFGDGPLGARSLSGDIGLHVLLSAVGFSAAKYSGYTVEHPGRMDVLLGLSVAGRMGAFAVGPWQCSVEMKVRVAVVGRDRANSDFISLRLYALRSLTPSSP